MKHDLLCYMDSDFLQSENVYIIQYFLETAENLNCLGVGEKSTQDSQ